MDAKAQKEFRTKLYTDLCTGVIPERIPVQDSLAMEYSDPICRKRPYDYAVHLFCTTIDRNTLRKRVKLHEATK